MVSKAWIRHKKNQRDPFDEHWIVKLPPAPGIVPGEVPWGICTKKSCEGWTPTVLVSCVYGLCNEVYCDICGRAEGSWGPIDCPCADTTKGHSTLAERSAARGKVNVTVDEEGWPTFTVVPFTKFNKRRKGW